MKIDDWKASAQEIHGNTFAMAEVKEDYEYLKGIGHRWVAVSECCIESLHSSAQTLKGLKLGITAY